MFIKEETGKKHNLPALRPSNTADQPNNGSLEDLMFHTPSFGEEEYSFLQDKPEISLKANNPPDFSNSVFNNNYFDHTNFTSSQTFSQLQSTDFLSTIAGTPVSNSLVYTPVQNHHYQHHQQQQQQQQKQHLQELQQQQQQTSPLHSLQRSFYNSKSLQPASQRGFTTMSTERDSIFESLENIAPKFPPQDVDIPDISSTNGVGAVTTSSITTSILNTGYSGGVVYEQAKVNTSPRTHPDIGMHSTQPDSTNHQMVATTTVSPVSSTVSNTSNTSLPVESSEDSDDSVPLAQLVKRQAHDEVPSPPKPPQKPAGVKKPRMPKKKKRKDPNEPNKPVSAYALFFRDTQAAIKGQNPNATFGEVSKIVASMWESLDPEHKNVYKKKTELAKKEYLKQLAAYRASLVSQTRVEESPSPPHRSPTGTSPQHMMGYMNNISPQHMGSPAHMGSPGHMVGSPAQMVAQSPQHISSPHHITSPQHVSSPPNMLGHQVASPPHPAMYNQSPAQYNMNPYTNGQVMDHNGMRMESQHLPPTGNNSGRSMPYGMCIRTGCGNRAIESLGWDNEYCSNECVVSHCRDVFTAWVSNRSVPTNSFTVK